MVGALLGRHGGVLWSIVNLPARGKVKPPRKDIAMRIGELAEATGTTAKTLRFYEDSGLLRSDRAANGYREYGQGAVARLDFIRRGRAAGLTLAQVREVIDIRETGDAPCGHVHDLLSARLDDIDSQLADLQALRGTVAQLRDEAGRADPAICTSDAVCRYL
jgi:DNA-binding transcriptional MerR regulator